MTSGNSGKKTYAIVTGGSRGIGKVIALEFAKNSTHVAIIYRNDHPSAKQTSKELLALDPSAICIEADVSNEKEITDAVDQIVKSFGRVDILVNNAGINRDRTVGKMSLAEWNEVIATNLTGPFLCTRAVLPTMVKQKHGRIVNVSSVIGQTGGFGQANYAASKGGLVSFTKTVALEQVGNNITCNAVCPGFIDTEMVRSIPEPVLQKIKEKIPQKRLGSALEVAELVTYLVSPAAAYITGQAFNINGGLYS
ncbi:MAG: 3-oxoacyl-ACP reductase FabG [Terriglobales bacterium]|jgi:acetoacetyl-CoA reductase